MTYRTRRERRLEQVAGSAERLAAGAATIHRENDALPYAHDIAFITQPGRIPERDRMNRREERAFRMSDEAERKAERAKNIEEQLAASIYDDDPDFVERMTARIAKLEEKREQIKAHNREHRGGKHCTCPPECVCRTRYGYLRNECNCTKHPMPQYVLTNLGGDIRRNKERLERHARQQVAPPRLMQARFASPCAVCHGTMDKGSDIYYLKAKRLAWHADHGEHPEGI